MTHLQDESYNSSIKGPLVTGMQELVLLAGFLLLPQPNKEDGCTKIHDHVSKIFHHFSEAEQKLESHLLLVDSQSEGLIAVKKIMEDELQEKKENLANLKTQIATLKEAEKKSQEMLEAAKSHAEQTREQLKLAHEEVAKNLLGRKIGIRLMALPGFGSLVGVGMFVGYQAALKSAENLVAEAQEAVDKCVAEVISDGDEIARFSQKEQEVQDDIDSMEQKIPQKQAQCDELLCLHGKVIQLQSQIRKCLSLLDLLAGKIHVAMVMSSHACVPVSLVDILEEIAGVMGGENEASIHADKEIQALVLELNKAVQSLTARTGKSMPSDH